jgi:ribonucleoside-diphosphate reductase beta chain
MSVRRAETDPFDERDSEDGTGADHFERLYLRWEQQPWSALEIDLDVDKAAWPRIPTRMRSEMWVAINELGGGDVAVTRLLTPLIDHAPRESWRIYLTTQLSDEAKHAVFFRRYKHEVLNGHSPDPRYAELVGFDESAYATEFEPELERYTAAVRAEPRDGEAWHRASVLYHLVTEGALGVSVLRLGQTLTGNRSMCPGLADGIAAVFRDESRHIGFGRAAAAEGMRNGHTSAIAESYLHGTRLAARVMVGPNREQPVIEQRHWRERSGASQRALLEHTRDRLVHQAERLRIPIGAEELAAAWAEARDGCFEEYRLRWGRPHNAETMT